MIRHVVRQERRGGFWLIRDQGRAVELGPAGYELMARLAEGGGRLAAGEGELTERVRQEPGDLLGEMARQGLGTPAAWRAVRHVPSGVPIRRLPADAAAAPKRIYFEITRRCNLACRSCFNSSRHPLPGELSRREVLEVNRQAFHMGVFEIRYTGGEATTVPWFPEVVADARRRGLYISLGTNGVYDHGQLEWLPHCGVDWFILSLDGDRETNDRVRGAGTFDRALATLATLSRHPALKLRLNMVVARHNLHTMEAVAAIADRFGVGSLNLIPLRPYGRSTRRMLRDMLDQEGFYAFIRRVAQLRRRFPAVTFSTTIDLLDTEATTSHDPMVQKKRTCAAGVEACVVGPQGHVYGCSYSPASFPGSGGEEGERLFIAGNLRRDDLGTIWRDSSRWRLFRDLASFKNPRCLACPHYASRCTGSCQIMAWHLLQRQGGEAEAEAALGRFYDPYCFVDLLDGGDGA